jgi:hypothetical protein
MSRASLSPSRKIPNRSSATRQHLAGICPRFKRRKLFFLDARLTPEVIKTGGFDFSALLAIAGAKAKELGAKRIVFDSIDILLALLDDPSAERQELFSLYHWLLESGMTGILTAKDDPLLPVETGHIRTTCSSCPIV